jgi:hypothetical protein
LGFGSDLVLGSVAGFGFRVLRLGLGSGFAFRVWVQGLGSGFWFWFKRKP